MLMFVLATGSRFYQELQSSKAVATLQKQVVKTAVVRRRSTTGESFEEVIVDHENIVPGDIVVLNAGSILPGDCVFITARELHVSQSSLTGESM